MFLEIGNYSISAEILISLLIIFFVLFFLVLFWLFKSAHSKKINSSFSLKLLKIRVPKFKSEKEAEADNKQQDLQEDISVAENLYSTLGGLRAQRGLKALLGTRDDHFSFEIVLQNGLIYFYIGVPQKQINFFKERIHSIYPDAEIESVEDYNIFTAQGKVIGASLRFKKDFIYPIKTYKKLEIDPLNSLLNSLTKLEKEDSAAIQIIARSAHKRWHTMSSIFTKNIAKGKKIRQARNLSGLGGLWGTLFSFIGSGSGFIKTKKEDKLGGEDKEQFSQMEQEMMKNIEEKNSKAGLDVNIRVVVNAQNQGLTETYLQNITNTFSQYNLYQYGNAFKIKTNNNNLINDFIYRNFNSADRILLNTEELTSIFHLPLSSNTIPKIVWLEARTAPAPENIPTQGLILGKNVYRDSETLIKIKPRDRSRHMYIIGKSGTGKSYFQINMAIQDIQNGEGVCVLDPHGDLIEDILKYIPKERAEDVILFDPSDIERPLGINMLEFDTQDQKTFVINEMIKIFDKLYDLKATGGPMFEQYMRNAMLLIMEDPESGSTLLEIPKVLADEDFRKYKLSKCQDYLVKDFWQKQAEKAGGEASLANMVPYITSKLTPFISNDIMRPIIAQQKSSFNFREVMDQKKILLINLSKGKIGELNSSLIGMVFVGKILMAALSRTNLPIEQRTDFYLYIDEFQNFITDSISIILSEARKYKLNLIIAHQYITQLVRNNDETIKDAVFGNVGTFVSFGIGVKDAEIIAKQFAPVFSEYDLVNVPAFNAYVKLLIDNYNPPAFSMKILTRDKTDSDYVQNIKKLSRLKYGRDKNIIEQEIKTRMQLAENVLENKNPIF